ncbi:MAG: YggS family pyridoxal phosphate-dependent enzyme [Betaproteobacteria bacterium]|nr:YggS family pyridoxal phosphate-dependent enzyme [Betaproteobacteria bacterium]
MALNPENNDTAISRLELVRSRISTAVFHRQDANSEITLIAVGKGHSSEKIRELYALGIRDFAENYAQEYFRKKTELSDLTDIRWHFIGHLQSNKAKKVAQTGCLIHGLDRSSLLEELIKSADPSAPTKILLQLQVDPTDTNKSGCSLAEAHELCAKISAAPGLLWEGFMGMGPADCPQDVLRMLYEKFMRNASQLWEKYSLRDPSRQLRPMKISLGMSDDLELAIRCGSNHIRIGSALFGARPAKSQAT